MTVVGVLPAAGYATRLQPLDCSKEVLPVGGRPVMDYVVERMHAGGATALYVVTREEKDDVIDHARTLGAHVVLADPETVTESFAAAIRQLADDDIVLVGWPDTIWEPLDGYRQLVDAVDAGREVAIGLFELTSDLERSDVVTVTAGGLVERVYVKPAVPPTSWVWGCAAARARALRRLEEDPWPGGYFDRLARQGVEIAAVCLSDVWLDIGTKDALAKVEHWLTERARAPRPGPEA